jgi:hypothetical protein
MDFGWLRKQQDQGLVTSKRTPGLQGARGPSFKPGVDQQVPGGAGRRRKREAKETLDKETAESQWRSPLAIEQIERFHDVSRDGRGQ